MGIATDGTPKGCQCRHCKPELQVELPTPAPVRPAPPPSDRRVPLVLQVGKRYVNGYGMGTPPLEAINEGALYDIGYRFRNPETGEGYMPDGSYWPAADDRGPQQGDLHRPHYEVGGVYVLRNGQTVTLRVWSGTATYPTTQYAFGHADKLHWCWAHNGQYDINTTVTDRDLMDYSAAQVAVVPLECAAEAVVGPGEIGAALSAALKQGAAVAKVELAPVPSAVDPKWTGLRVKHVVHGEGTVRGWRDDIGMLSIEFDDLGGTGHDCNGDVPSGNGLWFYDTSVTLLTPRQTAAPPTFVNEYGKPFDKEDIDAVWATFHCIRVEAPMRGDDVTLMNDLIAARKKLLTA